METLRDTAFGKLVRLFSRYRWMQYPEEQDASIWIEYLKSETEKTYEEPSMSMNEHENPEDLEAFGLYTVRSQLSTRSRRTSRASTVYNKDQSPSDSQLLVISWRGPDDSEVHILNTHAWA